MNRVESGQAPSPLTPEVKISLPSPRQAEAAQYTPAIDSIATTVHVGGLLNPFNSASSSIRALQAPAGKTATTRTRRSASVGALPSLDQIREWSLRRNGIHGDSPDGGNAEGTGNAISLARPYTAAPPTNTQTLSPPVIQVLGATPPKPLPSSERLQQLKTILGGTIRAAARQQTMSLPSSPVKGSFNGNIPAPFEPQERSHCARKMVTVLERRKSISLVR
ncbi:hypothetical protein P389DRAFT_53693 [Cystobasidium minutum MCA 4210]|uniref:uncharacterized protein n=1 Tax=Cystobasidium minutum MCA 4210 TaxID=1397322 RepID=UPI0034CDDFFB|eukprot:jgi/Rhomi1/53693/CE53692_129